MGLLAVDSTAGHSTNHCIHFLQIRFPQLLSPVFTQKYLLNPCRHFNRPIRRCRSPKFVIDHIFGKLSLCQEDFVGDDRTASSGIVALIESLWCRVSDRMSLRKEDSAAKRSQQSCVKRFDALWFCYSPVSQMQQYYRLGALDNCMAKWADLFDCLSLKTKTPAQVEAILDEREKSKRHIWSYRSPEEAASNWKKVFGHLDELE